MRGRLCCLLVLFFLCLVGATSRLLAPTHGFAVSNSNQVNDPNSPKINQSTNEGKKGIEEAKYYSGRNKIGSSPPSCEHKCYGCMPCEPIQVPTTTSRVGVQYTNYEPEGWKCKCGPTFYSP